MTASSASGLGKGSESGTARFRHVDARQRWGEPDAWEGSVNDPRTREEHGIRFNEKWIYRLPEGSQRLVYWHRYDCRGVLVESASGEVRPEAPEVRPEAI